MNSSKYFEDRSMQRMKKAHDKASVVVAKINQSYTRSNARLDRDIRRILGNVSDDPNLRREHLRRFINNAEYERTWRAYQEATDPKVKSELRRMLKESVANARITRKEAMKHAIKRERFRMTNDILGRTKKHLMNTCKYVLEDVSFADASKKKVEEVVKQNWLGGNYSSRVWHNQTVLAKRIEKEMFDQFLSGKSYKDMSNILKYLTDCGRYACNRLVRTETSFVVNTAELEDSKRRGIKAKKFNATLDARTSRICRENDGKIIPIDKIKIGTNAPPLHPYCRSHLSDLIVGWDYDNEEDLMEMINGEPSEIELNREGDATLKRIGKNQSVNSIERLKKVSKSSIISMENIDEAKEYINQRYSIDVLNFDVLDLDKSKIILSGLDDTLKKYPDTKNSVSSVIFDKDIKQDGLLRGADIHIGNSGLNYETIVHELAHVIDKGRSTFGTLDYSEKVLKEARKRLKLRNNSKKYEKLAYEIVGNNQDDYKRWYEVFAYSLETELTNNNMGNELSKTIKEVVDVYER